MHLLANYLEKFQLLKSDFIGFYGVPSTLLSFFVSFIFALLLFCFFYLIGERIRKLFFPHTASWYERCFISISLGYIALCTAITFLGMFSLLTTTFIFGVLGIFSAFFLFPTSSFWDSIKQISGDFRTIKHEITAYPHWQKIVIGVFVGITFLRLLPPEVGADAMAYHTTFPKLFLYFHTVRLPQSISPDPIAIPQMGEMPFFLAAFFQNIDASRMIHFLFYLFSVLLLFSPTVTKKKTLVNFYSILLLVTSPIVVHHAPSAYSDFPNLLCFMLSILVLIKEKTIKKRNLYLSAIIFGGGLATKMFTLAYLPGVLLFLCYQLFIKEKLSWQKSVGYISLFTSIAALFPLPWYISSYITIGNFFGGYTYLVNNNAPVSKNLLTILLDCINIFKKFGSFFIYEYSPFIIVGSLGLLLSLKKSLKIFLSFPLGVFGSIFLLLSLFFPATLYQGRYLLPIFTIFSIPAALGLSYIHQKHVLGKVFLLSIVFILGGWYTINTLEILPYGIGIAKKENYVNRILSLNYYTYYDFTGTFSSHFSRNEHIATYSMDQFYYANFLPLNVYYFFEKNNKSLSLLPKHEVNKLLIRGGDINWFCKKERVKDCTSAKLLVGDSIRQQYLYKIY